MSKHLPLVPFGVEQKGPTFSLDVTSYSATRREKFDLLNAKILSRFVCHFSGSSSSRFSAPVGAKDFIIMSRLLRSFSRISFQSNSSSSTSSKNSNLLNDQDNQTQEVAPKHNLFDEEVRFKDINQNMDDWNIPEIPQDQLYVLETIKDKHNFDYIIKTVEYNIPLGEEFHLLSKTQFMNIVETIKPLIDMGIDAAVLMCLRDIRHNKFEDSLIGTVETSLGQGPVYFNCYLNKTVSLMDRNILDSLFLNIHFHGLDMKEGSIPAALIYRIQYKVMNTCASRVLLQPQKGETTLFITDMTKANISLKRIIKWDEVTLPKKWVMEKATPSDPRPTPIIKDIKQDNSGKVEITFNRRNSFSSRIEASRSEYESARRSFSVRTRSIPVGLTRSELHNQFPTVNLQGLDTTSSIPRTTYNQDQEDDQKSIQSPTYSSMEPYNETLRKYFYSPANEPQRRWFFQNYKGTNRKQVQDKFYEFVERVKVNVLFFDWFHAYSIKKDIDYSWKQDIIGDPSTNVITNWQVRDDSNNKPIMATPFKTKDINEEVTSEDIKSLMEQANYTNKYLQILGETIKTKVISETPQTSENTSKMVTRSTSKLINVINEDSDQNSDNTTEIGSVSEKNINPINSKHWKTPSKLYYQRPTAPDLLLEERGENNFKSFSANNIYEWNIDAQMDAVKTDLNRKVITNDDEKEIPDTVNTLIFTIARHFIGDPSLWKDRSTELLSNLKCRTLADFRWYKDTFLTRVYTREDSQQPFWKEKFLAGLPRSLGDKVRDKIRSQSANGDIPYENLSYGQLISCVQKRQLAKEKAQTKRDLGSFCEQFGLPACPKQKKKQTSRKEIQDHKSANKRRFSKRRYSQKPSTSKEIENPKQKIKSKITCYNCGKQGHIKTSEEETETETSSSVLSDENLNLIQQDDQLSSTDDDDKQINTLTREQDLLFEAINSIPNPQEKKVFLEKLKKTLEVKPRQKDFITNNKFDTGSSTQKGKLEGSLTQIKLESSTQESPKPTTTKQTVADYAWSIQTLLALEDIGLTRVPKLAKKTWAEMASESDDDSETDLQKQIQKAKQTKTACNQKPSQPLTQQESTPQPNNSYISKNKFFNVLQMELEYWDKNPFKATAKVFPPGFHYRPTATNKTRKFYEFILIDTNSVSIKHFKDPKDPNLNTHSTIQILKVMQPRHYGSNLNQPKKFSAPFDPTGYNYWDYIDAWTNVFWHQNSKIKHSWLIYFKNNTVYNFPNWFLQWWNYFRPIPQIFPEEVQQGFQQFTKLFNSKESRILADLKCFSSFALSWIFSWQYRYGKTENSKQYPPLQRHAFVNKIKHSWLIYFKNNTVYNFPNWFLQWWNYFRPIPQIFPEEVQQGFQQFTKLFNSKESRIPTDLKYFSSFSLSWIFSWQYRYGKTENSKQYPPLQRHAFNNIVYNFPNWFLQWWNYFGPIPQIFPEEVQQGFQQFTKLFNSKESRIPADLKYFSSFALSWIFSWQYRYGKTENNKQYPPLQRHAFVKWWPQFDTSKAAPEQVKNWFQSNPEFLKPGDPETSLFLNQKSQLSAFLASSKSKESLAQNLKEVLQLLQQEEEEEPPKKEAESSENNDDQEDDPFYQNEDDCFGISLDDD
ncbi:polyprotein [Glycine soja]